MKIKSVICLDHISFDMLMEDKGWIERPPKHVAVVSICSPNEADLADHWFKNDYHNSDEWSIFNLDIDDISPFWFENHESECYDKALDLYLHDEVKQSNRFFSNFYISGENKEFMDILHCMDYEEAFDLVTWIEDIINDDEINTIYVHCAAGASRSQGVVRYIVDTYGKEYDILLNPHNPNNTYNPHVVMMLKRAYRTLHNIKYK